MHAVSLAMLLAAAGAAQPLEEALRQSLADPAARLELVQTTPEPGPGCALSGVDLGRRIVSSGRYAAKLAGAGCHPWIWVRVKVVASVRVAARNLASGESLDGATRLEEREVPAGKSPLVNLPTAAVASRSLIAGQMLEPHHVREAGPKPGDLLVVVAQAGTVSIVQEGRAVPCDRGRTCAQLPSGKRVSGRFDAGRLLVEAP